MRFGDHEQREAAQDQHDVLRDRRGRHPAHAAGERANEDHSEREIERDLGVQPEQAGRDDHRAFDQSDHERERASDQHDHRKQAGEVAAITRGQEVGEGVGA